jgi:hypothetical protein
MYRVFEQYGTGQVMVLKCGSFSSPSSKINDHLKLHFVLKVIQEGTSTDDRGLDLITGTCVTSVRNTFLTHFSQQQSFFGTEIMEIEE